ncbi:MAG TPA: DUF444 family protein [Planctomycetes bacterium]|nr:DUF444 family protein [Planctomycetota bacterium]
MLRASLHAVTPRPKNKYRKVIAVRKIDPDANRFRKIVRGKIRENLKQYVSQGEILARKGKNLVSVPLPQIDIPDFRFGHTDQGGVGQGSGEEGKPLGGEQAPPGPQAGDQPGEHILEVDVTIDELADILGEELELPRIEPRGSDSIQVEKQCYTGINRTGPDSLRHFRRTFKNALRRQIASGIYDAENPCIVPVREDRRYRSWNTKSLPQSNALIVYMMDVSGSMGNEQKDIVRIESFWIDTWLKSQYENLETRYIIHDAQAKLVDSHTFFHVRESGGTKISSAYNLAKELILKEFSPSEWNIYPFHFSDGDNWGGDDTAQCLELLRETLIPFSNVFCYGQVKSAYGSGQFIKDLREAFGTDEKVLLSEINSRDEILPSIKTFLGKGC